MLVIATKDGYYGKYRYVGDTFSFKEDREIPSWCKAVEPVAEKVKEKAPKKPKAKKEPNPELDAMRAEAKTKGFKNWHNAREKKLKEFLDSAE